MNVPAYSSYLQWYSEGQLGSYVRTLRSAGEMLSLLEAAPPPGDNSGPAVPDLVLAQDMLGGSKVTGNLGGGRFDVMSKKGGLFLAAPHFARTSIVDINHQIRAVAFPVAQWQTIMEESVDGQFAFDFARVHDGMFDSPAIRSTLRKLWSLCEDEGAPSRLLARAAGCEILAELCRLGGAPFTPARGGLASWAERNVRDLMRARLSEDISLDELAAEAQLSPFHFARMFKQSVGVPPRVYLTRLRVEKACELLEHSDLPITEIALDVGYSSNQVLARVFSKHMCVTPSDYRRAVRDPVRSFALR
ncbi:transcriptional regulator, AraC family [Palleronia marisminoris]|uniref:Right origin-binding protein n=1 Tax=Palleronia marisminoris TaxID=315423 RepID=A0A1Y5TN11_9RHOB|nr:AraC family transcriptional regulator [Palleronia marisminoris]SFH45503.1 transcriptional regulator, AraC family [Palleronia marisminoris]SLN67880.1 Right origin-binding protein [Palleronia marisminoris]